MEFIELNWCSCNTETKLFMVLVGLRMARRLLVIPLKSFTGVMFGGMNRPILWGGGGAISTGCNPTGGVIYL